MPEKLTGQELQIADNVGLDEAIAFRLKALAVPGAVLTALKSVWEDTVIGATIALPAEGFDLQLEGLRRKLLPQKLIPFATQIAWREREGFRTLGVVPGTGDDDLMELLQPSGIASVPEIEYEEIVERLSALRDAYGLHITSAGACWVEIVLHTLPKDWEAFLTQVSGFGGSGSFNNWYTKAQDRMDTAQPGFSDAVHAALRDTLFRRHRR